MPRPMNDRQPWERELREELPARLAEYQYELGAAPPVTAERRERLEWQIRRVQKRMAEIEARLANALAEGGSQ
jgi:DNA repair exonuclease SbcCD ATPase subunit